MDVFLKFLGFARRSLAIAPTKTNEAVKQQQPFRFLDLPPELRNQIYHLHFSGHKVEISAKDPDPINRNQNNTPAALLLANDQIYAEAIGIFYHSTIFYLWEGSPQRLVHFLRAARLKDQTVECVRIMGWWLSKYELAGAFNLRRGLVEEAGLVLREEVLQLALRESDRHETITWMNGYMEEVERASGRCMGSLIEVSDVLTQTAEGGVI